MTRYTGEISTKIQVLYYENSNVHRGGSVPSTSMSKSRLIRIAKCTMKKYLYKENYNIIYPSSQNKF